MRARGVGALAAVVAAIAGCGGNGDCDGAGTAVSETRATPVQLFRVVVSTETDGAVVVAIAVTTNTFVCPITSTPPVFYRWNASTRRAEPSARGPASGARVRAATTVGGATSTFEDLSPGLTLRVADGAPVSDGVTITFETAGTSQRLRCLPAAATGAPVCTESPT